ncbi:membrane protein [Candidatus Magnetobacterium bavaricum]|uniref:Membrane protein n=1 Tax=Candidatus Magnetobacterium bavaricum TaxID=29290 RepID=A0A0F3GJ86_9BACT|nr:membrane protein [Candidatus Magnetobacterium bavaricum]
MEEKHMIEKQRVCVPGGPCGAEATTSPIDFFKVSVRGIFKSALISGAVFFLAAVAIHHLAIKTQGTYSFFKAIESLLLLVSYCFMGGFMGMAWGFISTLDTTAGGLHRSVREVIGPLITEIIEGLPLGDMPISIDVFIRVIDSVVERFSRKERGGFKILPPFLILSKFFIRTILQYLRDILIREFIQTLRDRGQEHLTFANLEDFIRNKLVDVVVEGFRCRLNTMRYLICTISLAMLMGPFVLILLL